MTVAAPGFRQEFRRALDDIERGIARRLAFAAPAGTGWLLPLYELALLTADNLAERGVTAELLVVTPRTHRSRSSASEASEQLDGLLAERGIELLAGHRPVSFDANGLVTVPVGAGRGGPCRRASRRCAGRASAGCPRPSRGFIATDRHGRVLGADDVYAAGDGTAFPVKQGGLAAQQADAAAAAIAAAAGVGDRPEALRTRPARAAADGRRAALPAPRPDAGRDLRQRPPNGRSGGPRRRSPRATSRRTWPHGPAWSCGQLRSALRVRARAAAFPGRPPALPRLRETDGPRRQQ